jgi:hypothetical protein
MMMTRRSFLFGLALAVVMAVLVFVSVNAKPKKRRNVERISGPPTLTLAAEPTTVRACDDARVQLTARASSLEGRPLRYKWTTNGGRLSGQGASPTWDLAGAQPGVYQAVVEVDDGRYLDCVAFSWASIVVADCPPPPPPRIVCPNVSVSCPDAAAEGQPATFSATISGGSGGVRPTYNWTVSAGRIISGQGTPSITVDTAGLAGQTIRADFELGGYGMRCPATCATSIPVIIKPRKFDEYYDIARNDEKARLDNYAIQLQGEPGSHGYIFVYPSSRARANEAQARARRISDYLVNSRGIDASRFTVTIAAAREDWLFELWIVPAGATPPTPSR